MRRSLALMSSITVCAALGLVSLSASSASAHAIIELDGVSAVAGATSGMTLEIQHGCLPVEATTRVEAFVGTPWRAVRPGAVAGWATSVDRLDQGGWHVVWTNLGEPIPFGKPTFFPITVDWPSKPGTYAMRVRQQCTHGATYDWNEKYGPATANQPSPPLTPRPEVKVVAKAAHPSSNPHPSASAMSGAHAH